MLFVLSTFESPLPHWYYRRVILDIFTLNLVASFLRPTMLSVYLLVLIILPFGRGHFPWISGTGIYGIMDFFLWSALYSDVRLQFPIHVEFISHPAPDARLETPNHNSIIRLQMALSNIPTASWRFLLLPRHAPYGRNDSSGWPQHHQEGLTMHGKSIRSLGFNPSHWRRIHRSFIFCPLM